MIVHCLFEQSGTFKNEFKKLGYEMLDDGSAKERGYMLMTLGEIAVIIEMADVMKEVLKA